MRETPRSDSDAKTSNTSDAPLLKRRGFLQKSLAAGAAVAAPMVIPASALGLDGAVPPSERIVVGGIGIGRRGTYDLGCFMEQPDVQFAAVCDIKEAQRQAVKKKAEEQ
ncbi:twin-arginine translocation signal domain-containing protein, partial [bacterium]|nr:twin-arginine translocation signal domain-containing protein [bacterium]